VRGRTKFVGRTFRALDSEDVSIVAIAQGSTECTISFVVSKEDVRAALASIHREFQLGNPLNQIVVSERENYLVPCVSPESSQLADQKL
jgi:hypothetical protein